MISTQNAGRLIGALLIVQMAGLIVPFAMLHPLVSGAFLNGDAGNALQIKIAALLLVLNCMLTVGMSALLWPVFRRQSPALAALLVVAGLAILVLQAIDSAHILSILDSGRAYVVGGATGDGYESAAAAIRSSRKLVHYSELVSIDVWISLMYVSLLRFRLVPRALAIFGMLTVLLHFGGLLLPMMLGYSGIVPLGAAMALGHLVLAGWLLAKGFVERPPCEVGQPQMSAG